MFCILCGLSRNYILTLENAIDAAFFMGVVAGIAVVYINWFLLRFLREGKKEEEEKC